MTVQQGSWEKSDDLIPYFRPNEGANVFRVVGSPVTTFSHWVRTAPSGKNQKFGCPGKDSCPLCKAGVNLLVRNCFLIYDRASLTVKVYEAPGEVFKAIKAYATDEDYGDVTKYDFKLNRSGQGLLTQYQVTPKRKQEPLTDEEQAKVSAAEKQIDWKKLYPQRSIEELEQVVENFDPSFIEEIEKNAAERARRKAEKAGQPAPQMQTVTATSKPAASAEMVTQEKEFFQNKPSEDFDLNDLDWGND